MLTVTYINNVQSRHAFSRKYINM